MSVAAEGAVESGRGRNRTDTTVVPVSPVSDGLSPPPKLRRRPVLLAASVAAVCLGALLGAWAWTSTSDTQQVVAVRSTIQRGQVITRADLVNVQVGVDPALASVPAAGVEALVGKRAALDMSAGSLVTPADVTSEVLPPAGMSVVGVGVPAGLLPGTPLLVGDHIRVVLTPGAQGEATNGPPKTISAVVVGVSLGGDAGPGAQVVVSVQVPESNAAELAAWAATGKVAIVLDSRER